MNKKLIIGIIVVVLVIASFVFISKKKEVTQIQNSSDSMQGMDMSMPGMDHGSMKMDR